MFGRPTVYRRESKYCTLILHPRHFLHAMADTLRIQELKRVLAASHLFNPSSVIVHHADAPPSMVGRMRFLGFPLELRGLPYIPWKLSTSPTDRIWSPGPKFRITRPRTCESPHPPIRECGGPMEAGRETVAKSCADTDQQVRARRRPAQSCRMYWRRA